MLASTFLLSARLRTDKVKALFVGVIVASALVVGSVDYEVRAGDTLSQIAAAHDVTLDELLAANDIDDPDLIVPGQRIAIPGEGGSETVHVVEPGETLGDIAARYSAASDEIASANSLADPDVIRVGQRLVIPGGSGGGGGSQPAEARHHVVEPGDTLSSIASAYGVSADQIAEANGITDHSTLYVGARLALSGDGFVAEPEAPRSGAHTVAAGETLTSIARMHGVAVSDIVSANGIGNVNVIRVGQQLQIPGGSSGGWVCPVPGGEYMNDWGFPRHGGRFHEGNDLFAPRGTEVLAPVGGQIQLISGDIGGFQFRLYGDDDVTYIGTHLDAFGRAGRVEAGEVIGYVGDTGNARGGPTHLHFEMLPGDGDAVNPFPTLQKHGC